MLSYDGVPFTKNRSDAGSFVNCFVVVIVKDIVVGDDGYLMGEGKPEPFMVCDSMELSLISPCVRIHCRAYREMLGRGVSFILKGELLNPSLTPSGRNHTGYHSASDSAGRNSVGNFYSVWE